MRPHQLRVHLSMATATAVGTAALLIAGAGSASAAVPFTFSVGLTSTCVSGTAPDNDSLTVSLKDVQGRIAGSVPVTANASGSWSDACFPQDVQPGQSITASDGTHNRTFKVPAIIAHLTASTDVSNGIAPKNSHVTLELEDCASMNCAYKGERTAHTSASGAWHSDWTSVFNVRGDDYVAVYWTSPNQDTVDTYAYSGYTVVTIGDSAIGGEVGSGATGTVTLKHGSTLRGTSHVVGEVPGGYFDGDFLSSNGTPVAVVPGNKVHSTFGTSFTVGNLSVAGHKSADTVTGTCPANRPFEVYAHDATYPYRPDDYSYQYGTANGSGHVAVDTTAGGYSSFDLQAGDQVVLYCALKSGDQEAIRSIVP